MFEKILRYLILNLMILNLNLNAWIRFQHVFIVLLWSFEISNVKIPLFIYYIQNFYDIQIHIFGLLLYLIIARYFSTIWNVFMRVESSKVRGSICLFFSFTDAYDTLKSIKNHDIQKSTFWLPMEYRRNSIHWIVVA